MDAFFASVELLRYPQLKGLPMVIGGGRRKVDEILSRDHAGLPLHEVPVSAFPLLKDYVGRGVITTATYAARQFGVGSAMGMMKAAKLCPQAIVLPVDFDEVYIDFTDVPGGQREGGRVLARLIQKSILEATGLTCSIGVAPNKLIAKLASEFNKPNGISVVHESDLESKIWPLAVRKV
ncbi:MAG: DNA polymerase IV, partial [Comamonadaceae bacterium]